MKLNKFTKNCQLFVELLYYLGELTQQEVRFYFSEPLPILGCREMRLKIEVPFIVKIATQQHVSKI